MKNKRMCLFSFALALMLTGCGILRPGPDLPEWGYSSPVTLEISVDPAAPGGIAFAWSEKAAEMLDVTVTSRGPDSSEITISIRPQPVQLH